MLPYLVAMLPYPAWIITSILASRFAPRFLTISVPCCDASLPPFDTRLDNRFEIRSSLLGASPLACSMPRYLASMLPCLARILASILVSMLASILASLLASIFASLLASMLASMLRCLLRYSLGYSFGCLDSLIPRFFDAPVPCCDASLPRFDTRLDNDFDTSFEICSRLFDVSTPRLLVGDIYKKRHIQSILSVPSFATSTRRSVVASLDVKFKILLV